MEQEKAQKTKRNTLFGGSLIRRLAFLFLGLGVIPAILFTIVPTALQAQSIGRAANEVRRALKQHSEAELFQLANTNALRYNLVFEAKAEIVKTMASYITRLLNEDNHQSRTSGIDIRDVGITNEDGWTYFPEENQVGFLASPLMKKTEEIYTRQRLLSTVVPLLRSIVEANPLIRSAFIITEDQTVWLYPNLFFVDGKLRVPSDIGLDLTQRPYYGESEDVVWTSPYVDREAVVTAAFPVYDENGFYGMVGIDFSLVTIVNDILQTEIGERGYMFIISQGGRLINMPERGRTSILAEPYAASTQSIFSQTLMDVVAEPVRQQFEALAIDEKLAERKTFVQEISTLEGDAYFAFAPMPTIPWHVVLVKPTNETLYVASNLENTLKATNRTLFILAMITVFGFFGVIILGGFINLRRLALPIQALATGAEKIRQGDYSYRVPVPKGEHEMTKLTQTFNSMVESVQHTMENRKIEFDAINRIAELANKQEKISTLLENALKIAQEVTQVDILALILVTENGEYKFAACSCDEDCRSLVSTHFASRVDEMVIVEALTARKNIFIPDVFDKKNIIGKARIKSYQRMGVHQVAFFPMVSKGKALGVLVLMQRNKEEIPFHVISYLEAVLKHISILIENNQLQRQNRDLIIMDERCRLATDLHDSVVQSLFTISLAIEGLKVECCDKKVVSPALELLGEQVQFVQKEMRTLITELRPLNSQDEYLSRILQTRINTLKRISGVEASFHVIGNEHLIPASIRLNLEKIAQEALSNIARHAQASKVEITMEVTGEMVTLTITDDGVGFDPGLVSLENEVSFGLLSMRERAEMVNGVLFVRSRPGAGTTIVAKIPLTPLDEQVAYG